jgi:flavin-binding protein dodecin
MGLTRPKIWDLDTNIEYFMDPITVLHQGATQANVDVGFLFNRANGLVSNVAVYWSEASQSIVTAFTNNTGSTNSNVVTTGYANLTIGSLLSINGNIYLNGVMGTPGQFITATNAGVAWTATPFTGGYIANQSTFGSNLVANSATASTSTTTGALVVAGGTGISGNLYVGTNLNVTGTLTYGSATATEISTVITSIGTSPTSIDSFANTAIRGAKYVISVQDVVNSQSQVSEILLAQDGANVNITSYGVVYTGPTQRMTFSSNISSGTVTLWATGVSTNNTVKLSRTALPM